MIDKNTLPYRQGVVAYVKNSNNEYLIFQHPDWKETEWRIPGGGIKEGEDYVSAIKRELLEEFGILTEIKSLSSLINQFEWPDELIQKNIDSGKVAYRGQQQKQVLIEVDNDIQITTDPTEVKAYKWISINDFQEYFVHPGQAELAMRTVNSF